MSEASSINTFVVDTENRRPFAVGKDKEHRKITAQTERISDAPFNRYELRLTSHVALVDCD